MSSVTHRDGALGPPHRPTRYVCEQVNTTLQHPGTLSSHTLPNRFTRCLRHLAHPSHALTSPPPAAREARATAVACIFNSPLASRGTPFGRPSQCAGPDLNLTHSARFARSVPCLKSAPALRSLCSSLTRGSFHSPLVFRGTPFGRPSPYAGPDLNLTHSARFARSVPCFKSAPALRSLRSLMRGTGFEPADSYETAS